MPHGSRLLAAGLAGALTLTLSTATAGSSEGPELSQPEEWAAVVEGGTSGLTAPLRSPVPDPLQIADHGFAAVAPDGIQVAWGEPEGLVVSDIWGGGRRTFRLDLGGPVEFAADSSAVVFVSEDALRQVDLDRGTTTLLASSDRLEISENEGACDLRPLPTGDVLVAMVWQWPGPCSEYERPLLWRRDTGAFQRLPAGRVTPEGQHLVTIDRVDGQPHLRVAPVRAPADVRDLARLDAAPTPVAPGAIRPDGRMVALTYPDGTVEVRSLEDGSIVASDMVPDRADFDDGDGQFPGALWAPDGRRVAVTAQWPEQSFHRQPWVLDLDTGDAAPVVDRDHDAIVEAWDDAGRVLVTADSATHRVEANGDLTRVARGTLDSRPRRPVVGPVARYAGEDRVATALALSRGAFDSADSVVIARSDLYPDALAGSALAGQLDGPVLLTDSEGLDPRVATEVGRLGTTTAYILGTSEVMSRQVADDLRTAGVERVVRVGGPDRFATAALVAHQVAPRTDHAYLVEGADHDPSRGWPDAVAVAGPAATSGTPVLLSHTHELPAVTRDAIVDRGVSRVTIIGGPVAISDHVERQVRSLGVEVERVAGQTRYATSMAVAERSGPPRLPVLVTGENWPDALTAGPAIAHVGGIVLLSPSSSITASQPVEAYLNEHAGLIDRAAVAGSTGVISQRVVRELAAMLDE